MFGGALAGLLRWVDKNYNRLTAFIENGERRGVVHAGKIHRRHVADFQFRHLPASIICQPVRSVETCDHWCERVRAWSQLVEAWRRLNIFHSSLLPLSASAI